MTMNFILIALMIMISISAIMLGRHVEKESFNNGYCKNCNKKLRHFDNDSQGGRGYCCDSCGETVWVSYNVDKNFES